MVGRGEDEGSEGIELAMNGGEGRCRSNGRMGALAYP